MDAPTEVSTSGAHGHWIAEAVVRTESAHDSETTITPLAMRTAAPNHERIQMIHNQYDLPPGFTTLAEYYDDLPDWWKRFRLAEYEMHLGEGLLEEAVGWGIMPPLPANPIPGALLLSEMRLIYRGLKVEEYDGLCAADEDQVDGVERVWSYPQEHPASYLRQGYRPPMTLEEDHPAYWFWRGMIPWLDGNCCIGIPATAVSEANKYGRQSLYERWVIRRWEEKVAENRCSQRADGAFWWDDAVEAAQNPAPLNAWVGQEHSAVKGQDDPRHQRQTDRDIYPADHPRLTTPGYTRPLTLQEDNIAYSYWEGVLLNSLLAEGSNLVAPNIDEWSEESRRSHERHLVFRYEWFAEWVSTIDGPAHTTEETDENEIEAENAPPRANGYGFDDEPF
jgi:hypothetical protein